MGTATTLCTVDKRGNYIGGVILPGLKVSLTRSAARRPSCPHISLEVPSHVIGKNTIDCMRSGIIYGNVDMIDGILDRMEKELGEPPTIIATGGLA
ncbi:MAG: type III pantothenate kinase [Enterocloster clostridioformis]